MRRQVKMKANTPLNNGYLIKAKLPNFAIKTIDKIIAAFFPFKKKGTDSTVNPKKINRILLCNTAHLGDVIIATSIVELIKKHYPSIEIGFLAGSWAKNIIDKHPLIARVHYFDHWHLNRANLSVTHKLLLHLKTMRRALFEIKNSNYDIAIDLYPFFENSIFLLWRSQIPVRVGYISGGLGALLTHPKIWNLLEQHIAYYHLDLVRVVFPDLPKNLQLKPVLPTRSQINLSRLLPEYFCQKGYIVCHPGSGEILRNWPATSWAYLKDLLVSNGYYLTFTGLGNYELQYINSIIGTSATNCLNLCDKLSWTQFVEIMAHAKCLVGVDSSASHVAAALDIPSVVICGGMVNYKHWQPLSTKTKVLHKSVKCLPCYSKRACKDIPCIRKVEASSVYEAVISMLQR